jgi:hypothetical protein
MLRIDLLYFIDLRTFKAFQILGTTSFGYSSFFKTYLIKVVIYVWESNDDLDLFWYWLVNRHLV